jgi:hypothetical protein
MVQPGELLLQFAAGYNRGTPVSNTNHERLDQQFERFVYGSL